MMLGTEGAEDLDSGAEPEFLDHVEPDWEFLPGSPGWVGRTRESELEVDFRLPGLYYIYLYQKAIGEPIGTRDGLLQIRSEKGWDWQYDCQLQVLAHIYGSDFVTRNAQRMPTSGKWENIQIELTTIDLDLIERHQKVLIPGRDWKHRLKETRLNVLEALDVLKEV